jgi:hypothetical protein
MHRISGIRFLDEKFLREFEREARVRLAPGEVQDVLGSYTVRALESGVLLEFKDMEGIAGFLEKARVCDLAGRTFRIVKLICATPTGAYRMPISDVDRWAKTEIDRVAQDGRGRESLLFTSETYDTLKADFRTAGVPFEKYIR